MSLTKEDTRFRGDSSIEDALRAELAREDAVLDRVIGWTFFLAQILAAGSLSQHGGVALGEIPEHQKWAECPDVHICERDSKELTIENCAQCWLENAELAEVRGEGKA